jgi:hypothetical protein
MLYKKIEIWILYITLVFVFISYIVFGAMVRHKSKDLKPYKYFSSLFNAAYYIAEIPANMKSVYHLIIGKDFIAKNLKSRNTLGFSGENEDEKYLLLSRYDFDLKEGIIELVDLTNFKVLHNWNPDIDSYWENVNTKKG